MKKIKLTQGQFALVDDEDFAYLNQWKWHAILKKTTGNYYACRSEKGKRLWMHRIIINPKNNQVTDHINHDGCDNRRNNLRPCSPAENSRNKMQGKRKNGGKYKGVYRRTKNGKPLATWRAQIRYEKRLYNLGSFNSDIEAAIAYDIASQVFFGKFAKPNFNL